MLVNSTIAVRAPRWQHGESTCLSKRQDGGVTGSRAPEAIAEILDGADLDVLSSKKIRKQLEQKYGIDFTDRKKEIDGIVMALISEQAKAKPEPKEENGDAGGNTSAGSSHDDNDVSLTQGWAMNPFLRSV
ncbi:hypothetical protein IscW_ISCW019211 [Ixodes scapularis]|uniref:DEK-C domain-containing protein n=1 Tax=Ixodes scapularis TaxID=6945 RepID=B7PR23_IXOSC|nr:hypothetical protein IscW_ISCW019211 [Ixodes scapularis]|eukprot:XP_002436215.1 hypothetical protein IscW_ISCW019211 [Ixodes scapularis]